MRSPAAILFGLFLLLAPRLATAASVSLEPADTTVAVGATVRLRVVASPVADLKGFALLHSFAGGVLTLVGEQAGDVLTGAGRDYVAFPVADASAPVDSSGLEAAMLQGSTAGPGVLAYLEFTAAAAGDAHVSCEHAEFRDSANALELPGCAGAVVHVTGPVPVRRPTWGALKGFYRR